MEVVTLQRSSLRILTLRQHVLHQLKDNIAKVSRAVAASTPQVEVTKARTILSELCTLPSGPETRDLPP